MLRPVTTNPNKVRSMATVILKKPRGEHKAGASISVPFVLGQELVAKGEAEYPKREAVAKSSAPATVSPAERHSQEIDRLNDVHARAISELKAQHAEAVGSIEKSHGEALAKLTAELEAAQKTIAELNAKKKN